MRERKNVTDCCSQCCRPKGQQHSSAPCHRTQQHWMDFSCIHVPITIDVLSLKFFPWSLLHPYVYAICTSEFEERRGKERNFISPHDWSLAQDCNVFSLPLPDWGCCPFGGCFVTAKAVKLHVCGIRNNSLCWLLLAFSQILPLSQVYPLFSFFFIQIQGILWCTFDKLVMRCLPAAVLLNAFGKRA